MLLKKNILLLCGIAFLQGMVFYGPIATLYRQAAGISVLQITQIEAISLALCVALELPWGIVADRIGYRRTTVICCGLFFVSKIIFWKADSYVMFLLERILLAVAVAGLSGVDTSILYLSCEKEDAHRVFAVYQNCGTAGLIVAAAIYALWIGTDYRLAGWFTVLSYGLAAALALGVTEVKPPAKPRTTERRGMAEALTHLWRDKRTLALLLGTALLNETHQTVTVFLNQLQYVRAGMSDQAIGAVYIAVTVAGLLGGFSAKLARKWGHQKTGRRLFLGCAGACGVLCATRSAVLSVAAILTLRVGYSLYQPMQADLQNRRIASPDRATALSLNALLMEGTGVGTNLAYGVAAQTALPLAMGLGAVLCLAGFALFRAGFKNAGKQEDRQTSTAE